jgi:hypothetical protein
LDSTGFSESLFFRTGFCVICSSLTYCPSEGDDGSAEWIDSVAFGNIRLQSGSDEGYLLNNTVQTSLERKRAYQFHVKPASTFPDAEFFLRMWIDLNQDGLFTDSSELLVDPLDPVTSDGWTQSITIQDSVPLGNTRMRIALKAILDQDTIRPESCGNFLFGEVEDFCINISDLCPEVIVDDVITAGTAIGEAVDIIRAHDAEPCGVVICMDRQERGKGELSAVQEVRDRYKMEVIAVARLADLMAHLDGKTELSGTREALREYRERYGV